MSLAALQLRLVAPDFCCCCFISSGGCTPDAAAACCCRLECPSLSILGHPGRPRQQAGLISRRHVTIAGWDACVRNVARVAETLPLSIEIIDWTLSLVLRFRLIKALKSRWDCFFFAAAPSSGSHPQLKSITAVIHNHWAVAHLVLGLTYFSPHNFFDLSFKS